MSKIVKVARSRDVLLALLVGLVALIPRLIGLNVFLTADEPKSWFGRSIIFLDALARADWAATFDSPAPGVTTMWAGSIGLLLEYARQGFPGSLTVGDGNEPIEVAVTDSSGNRHTVKFRILGPRQ